MLTRKNLFRALLLAAAAGAVRWYGSNRELYGHVYGYLDGIRDGRALERRLSGLESVQ